MREIATNGFNPDNTEHVVATKARRHQASLMRCNARDYTSRKLHSIAVKTSGGIQSFN